MVKRRSALGRALMILAILAVGALGGPPARAAVGDNAVGMNVHDGREPFIDACVTLGVSWVRMDANWWVLEPTDGTYNWTALDAAVNDAVASGLNVYLTLAYTPDWVTRHGDTDAWAGNDVPDDSLDWSDFVGVAVAHYRALGVTHFGIWNEPNLTGFWEGTVNEYVNTILAPGAAAVRNACGDCLVLGPDLANVGDCDDFMQDVLTLAPANTFDIIAHHIYQGFAETGVSIWDGDSFINALDQQRFTFTRRDLRQVLDLFNYTGEVWITETGYRADPPGDTTEEDLQATYVTRVLQEQLLRAWYTNTFFYEILDCKPDQPSCGIDGYGLMRATGGTAGSRTFPTDYREKPAFTALQQFISGHSQFAGASAPQCGDGADNDGDGYIDLVDRGCWDGLDDDESDDPPRRAVEATPAQGLTLDGDLADWGTTGWVALSSDDWRGTEALSGAGDLAVSVAARWESGALWLAFDVTDDTQENTSADADLWQGDSVQLAFDVGQSFGLAYDDVDDHEINVALVGGNTRTYRFHGPSGVSDAVEAAVVRSGTQTSYEIRLPAAVVPGVTYADGTTVGFSFVVNDADGSGRVGWMEFTPGIGMTKAPYYFGELDLVDTATPPTDGGVRTTDGGTVTDGGMPPDDGSAYLDGGPTADSGTGPGDDGGSGCDCRTGGAGGGLGGLVWALLLLGYCWRRRRAAPPVRAR